MTPCVCCFRDHLISLESLMSFRIFCREWHAAGTFLSMLQFHILLAMKKTDRWDVKEAKAASHTCLNTQHAATSQAVQQQCVLSHGDLWLWKPTQLQIHKEWWSIFSTQRSQTTQWKERGDLHKPHLAQHLKPSARSSFSSLPGG